MLKDKVGLLTVPLIIIGSILAPPAFAEPLQETRVVDAVKAPPKIERAPKAVKVKPVQSKKYKLEKQEITSTPPPPPPPPPVEIPPVVVVANEVTPIQGSTIVTEAQTRESVSVSAPAETPVESAPTVEATPAHQATETVAVAAVSKPTKQKRAEPVAVAATSGIAGTAMAYLGSPYVWGGASPSGWDCSGFVHYVYAQHGISVPRGTSALRSSGMFVPTSNPQPGDLVFQNGGGHVGIYIGNGQIIGAQNPSVGTVLRPANSPYGPLTGYYTLAR